MHPFCCVSVVSDHSFPITLDMPPIPAPPRSDPAHRTEHALHSLTIGVEGGCAHPVLVPTDVDVRLKDLDGNGNSGTLHKWVNYGNVWRMRCFVLQDGVLSYYKIHGPDKIIVNSETVKGSQVIGEESARLTSRNRNSNHVDRGRKPVGEIHLKSVSTRRESRSDDKRFSVFTGTKRLHLRAETPYDRVEWMEAQQAVKDMFPRISNSDLMATVDNVAVSTEIPRLRLMEDGVSEEAIWHCEQILINEYSSLKNKVLLLK